VRRDDFAFNVKVFDTLPVFNKILGFCVQLFVCVCAHVCLHVRSCVCVGKWTADV